MSRALLTYTHNNTGNKYILLGESRIKTAGHWYSAKTYINPDLQLFTRTESNFDESFTFHDSNVTLLNRLKLRLIKYLLKSMF